MENVWIKMLPCNSCRAHFKQNLSLIPIEDYVNGIYADYQYFWHSVDLHNKVNEDLGKPILSKIDVFNYFKMLYESNLYADNNSRR